MKIHFYKFHGNGNDFIIIDNRNNSFFLTSLQINSLCNRRVGIGADGLIMLSESKVFDFEMVYYNADGNISTMCGNGGRCIAAFANMLGHVGDNMKFVAFDGLHEAVIEGDNNKSQIWDVSLQLADVAHVEKNSNYYFLDTGSPHYVKFVNKVSKVDVEAEGKIIRESEQFKPDGINVNFVEALDDEIFVRTFERGVEAETLSCGTGIAAAAIASYLKTGNKNVMVHSNGGDFTINFDIVDNIFVNVWLRGPAQLVFEGDILV